MAQRPLVEGTEIEEEGGTVVRLVEKHTIPSVEGGGIGSLTLAMDSANVPQYNERHSSFPYLICTRRAAQAHHDSGAVDVICEFVPIGMDGYNFLTVYNSNLTQIETQNDFNGNPITVSYTYPGGLPV